ncbi:leucine carboxyl methyltransferase 1 homolog, partial [Haematococcus lacustris]
VLVLGAGFDTTWWQLEQAGCAPTRYLELDFQEVTQRKASIIDSHPELLQPLHCPSSQEAPQDFKP